MIRNELKAVNLIIFPNWLQIDQVLSEITILLKIILSHPYQEDITLLIDGDNFDNFLEIEPEFLIANCILEIALESDLEIPDNFNLLIINETEDIDFIRSYTHLFRKVQLSEENQNLVNIYNAKNLSNLPLQCEVEIYLKLSQYYLQNQKSDQSIAILKKGIELNPYEGIIHFELIKLWQSLGKIEEGKKAADFALKFLPHQYIFKILKYLLLPQIYNSVEEIEFNRQAFTNGLEELINNTSLATTQEKKECLAGLGGVTNFFLAYQGYNDKDLQSKYGDLIHQIMAANYPQWVQPLTMPNLTAKGKIKIGYLSYFLHSWSGTYLFLNWLKYANKDQFEIYSYYIGNQPDHLTKEFAKSSDFFYHIPDNLEAVCQQVLADQLHILVFPELGMDGSTFRVAGLRLAPIQCMAWGHPVTSGIPTIDYFLSSELMEPENGQDHYREQLIRLPQISIFYPEIKLPTLTKSRSDFGLKDDKIIYLSSQAPYKYLPQYDYIYPQIALKIPNAQFMFLRTGIPQKRLEKSFSDVGLNYQDYCIFSPVLPRQEYLMLLQICDIYLDTFEWAGGNTTLDAIACHLPIVTYASKLMRGRHSLGMLKMIGVTETIANNKTEYLEIAIKLGNDYQYYQEIKTKLIVNSNCLFSDQSCLKGLETFYQNIVNNYQ